MRLNKHLILTIPDLIKHFSFHEFWENRYQFIRDLHPNKVYYWSKEQKDAYFQIKEWIEIDNSTDIQTKLGINALNVLLEGKIDLKDITAVTPKVDMSSRIIQIYTGQVVDLTSPYIEKRGDIKINLHKIEFIGSSNQEAVINLDGREVAKFKSGDVAYFTEYNGGCIEFLPNKLSNDTYELSLINNDGVFGSTLVVTNLLTNEKLYFEGVTSFSVLDDGYIYITDTGKPIFMTNMSQYMLKRDKMAVYTKSFRDRSIILYDDAVLCSTLDAQKQDNIQCASFSNEGSIIVKKLFTYKNEF